VRDRYLLHIPHHVYGGRALPFAQEMTLVFLGGVVTIALTAALLNRQTELELRKEGRVIILQQQCAIYMACIEKVAKIVENIRHDAVLIDDLRVLGFVDKG
jgi:peptidoglycan/LPS O-acetylase OafA/YrhL